MQASSVRLYYGVDKFRANAIDSGLRFLLGLAEAGLYPGVVFYMSW